MTTAVNQEELRAWMDANGYSVRTLAQALGINWRTVSRYKAGTPIPRTVELALEALERRHNPQPQARTTTPNTLEPVEDLEREPFSE